MYSSIDDEDDDIAPPAKAKLPVKVLLPEADHYLRNSRLDQAISTYNRVLQQDSNNFGALLGRAKCHLKLGKYCEAEEDLGHAVESNPLSTEAMYLKGIAEYFRGDFEKGFKTHRDAAVKRPFNDNLRRGHQMSENVIRDVLAADENSGFQKRDIEDLDESRATIDQTRYDAKGIYSEDLATWDGMLKNKNLPSSVLESSQDVFQFLKSRQRFAKMLAPGTGKKRPLKYRTRQTTAVSRLRRRFDELRSLLEKGLTDTCIMKVRELLNSLKKIPSEKSLEMAEIEAEAMQYLGLAYMIDGQSVTAAKCFVKQFSIGEKNRLTQAKVRARRNLGELYMLDRQYSRAFKQFLYCLEIASSEEQAILLYKLSDCATRMNDLEFAQKSAEDCLKQVVEVNDFRFQVDVLLLMAEISVKNKNMEVAYDYYQEAFLTAKNSQDSRVNAIEKLLSMFQKTVGKKLTSDEKLKIVNITQKLQNIPD